MGGAFFVPRKKEPFALPLKEKDGSPALNARGEPVVFTIQHIPNSRQNRLLLDHSRTVVGGEERTVEDPGAWTRAVVLEAIVGWSGVLDEDGAELPCAEEAKVAFAEEKPVHYVKQVFDAATGGRPGPLPAAPATPTA